MWAESQLYILKVCKYESGKKISNSAQAQATVIASVTFGHSGATPVSIVALQTFTPSPFSDNRPSSKESFHKCTLGDGSGWQA
jgi:hypothetical protein